MSGFCSKHKHYQEDCRICNVGRSDLRRQEIADMILYMVSVQEAEKPEVRAKALEIADKILAAINKKIRG